MRKTPGWMKQATPLNLARLSLPKGNLPETTGTPAPPRPAPGPPGPPRDPGPLPGGANASGPLRRPPSIRDGAAMASTFTAAAISLPRGSWGGGATSFGAATSISRSGGRRADGLGPVDDLLIRGAAAPPPGRSVLG